MKRIISLCLVMVLLLSGCASLLDGSYHSVTPHQQQESPEAPENIHAENYQQLHSAIANMAENGTQGGVIYVSQYDQAKVETDVQAAVNSVLQENPIAAYAVDEITWELGTNGGQNAVAVNIQYLHDWIEIRNIQKKETVEEAKAVISKELDNCSKGVVIYLNQYAETDFEQLVEDYALRNPQIVMETPQVTVNVYPEQGDSRVVEVKFTYQNSREALRDMQQQVSRVFASAALYINEDASDKEKYAQLYSFLMERHDYTLATSVTPSYSLLRHGVGDAKAFAMVYAAMCRESGLECQVISGSWKGEPWYWNLIVDNGAYYHVDLLASSKAGGFREMTDAQMQNYVWDYSAYPTELMNMGLE